MVGFAGTENKPTTKRNKYLLILLLLWRIHKCCNMWNNTLL